MSSLKKNQQLKRNIHNYPACKESVILSSAEFFQNHTFRKILPGIPSECQTVQIQIMQARHVVGPDLGPNCLQELSADDSSSQNRSR